MERANTQAAYLRYSLQVLLALTHTGATIIDDVSRSADPFGCF